VLDAPVASLDLLVVGDLAGVEDRVPAASDVHEGRFHAGKDVLHAAEVDVAHHRRRAGFGHVMLDQLPCLQDGDLQAVVMLGDEHRLVAPPLGLHRGPAMTPIRTALGGSRCPGSARAPGRAGGRG
jgi:hypothetical protein